MKHSGMELVVDRVPGAVPVAILRPRGNLDRLTYLELIDRSKEVYDSGQRFLILDMSEVNVVGISGLFALYSIAMIFRGEEPPTPEGGWNALRFMAYHLEGLPQPLKLLNPQSRIRKALSNCGLPIYDNLTTAMASF